MRKLLKEIHQQPEHIRKVFMWIMVVITFSLVGFFGLKSNIDNFVALVDPEKKQEESAEIETVAEEKNKSNSPFALISDSFSGLGNAIADLFSKNKNEEKVKIQSNYKDDISPRQFPLE